jgi:acyl carrier protein
MDTQTPRMMDALALERWLITRIAALASESEDEIDVASPFSRYALDSVATVGLTGDLQDVLGVELPPTLLWDFPTISSLARHLTSHRASSR